MEGPRTSRLGHKREEKKSVHNLPYGPRTRLIRSIYSLARCDLVMRKQSERRGKEGFSFPTLPCFKNQYSSPFPPRRSVFVHHVEARVVGASSCTFEIYYFVFCLKERIFLVPFKHHNHRMVCEKCKY